MYVPNYPDIGIIRIRDTAMPVLSLRRLTLNQANGRTAGSIGERLMKTTVSSPEKLIFSRLLKNAQN